MESKGQQNVHLKESKGIKDNRVHVDGFSYTKPSKRILQRVSYLFNPFKQTIPYLSIEETYESLEITNKLNVTRENFHILYMWITYVNMSIDGKIKTLNSLRSFIKQPDM